MDILEEIQNCPVEWKELGEVAEVGTGNNNTNEQDENGKYPFYVRSKNIKKINTYLFDEEAIVIPGEGDIGEIFHYIKGKYGLHQRAYRIHITVDNINTKFIYYYMYANFKKFIIKKAVSATVSSIRKPMIEKFLIPIPPLEIQEKIVEKLDKMTEYVTELTSELTSRKKQYYFYRDKLLSFEDEVYQVEWKILKDVATLKNGKDWKTLSSGEIPVYGSGGEMGQFVSNYSYDKPTVLIPRKGSISNLFYLEKAFWNVDTIYYTEIDDEQIIPKYFYYYLTTVKLEEMATNPTRPSLTQAILDKIRIPVPSLEIQSRIVQVLDNFDMVCNDLSIGLPKEIELRQKQYEYFREKLLTFVAEGEYTESRVEEWDNSAIIKLLQWVFGPIRVKLGVICDFVRGNGLQKKEFTENGKSVIHYGQIYTKYDFIVVETLSKTSEIVFEKLKKAYPNDLIMATTSENVEDVGKSIVWEGKEEIGISGDSYIIRTSQNSRYLNYWLRSISFQSQKERKVTGTKVVRINSKDMENFKIVLPPLTEQKRIVSILDNFNTLTNSISEGLPKEIELRQKQYEYWREQLLYFNE